MSRFAPQLRPPNTACLVFLAAALAFEIQAAPDLTTAESVHRLTREQAAAGQHAVIRGVVTCALPAFSAAVVQDGTAGIYIQGWNSSLGPAPELRESVEVEGVTDPGQFAPQVHAIRIQRLGAGELPAPVHPYWDQLINGSLDTEYVEIEGVITAVCPEGVTLLTHGGEIKILVFGSNGDSNGLSLKPYDGALVHLDGCLFASWGHATREVNVSEVRMYQPSVTVVEPAPADIFAIAPKHVTDLYQFDPNASLLRRVKVSGQVVHQRDGVYYAMDGKDGFRFAARDAMKFGIGDLVNAVGFPSLTGPSPELQEAVAQKIGAAPLPAPRFLDASSLFRAENDAVRVQVKAVLLNRSEDRQTLELQAGLQRFIARLAGDGAASDWPVGSQLELTGVYTGNGGNRTTGTDVANFELLLNAPSDARLVAYPQFWTLHRLLAVVGLLLAVLVLALVWIRLLSHKVQHRTAELFKEVRDRQQAEQQRALAQERARIARDLHDDLGSSLTEITMLATAGPGLKLPANDAIERMENIAVKSRTLVYALDEIVWAVDPERDTLGSAARYLASYTEEYLAGLKVGCRVQIPNVFPDCVVSGEARHHLFLAVKEALSNAVHHGAPSEIGFRVRVIADKLFISITDNGSGFATPEEPNGHGLLNIRHRLEHLRGQCDLESAPGAGTTVSMQVPLPVPDYHP